MENEFIRRERALIIFVKNLYPGKVKTRLARTMGHARALQVYEKLLSHTHRVTRKVNAARYVYYSDKIEPEDLWETAFYSKKRQSGHDLGNRMSRAITEVLEHHDKAILVGSDIPMLSASILDSAFALLKENDIVFGPAQDGGYYLIGMNSSHPEIFKDIPWSTGKVLEDSLELCRSNGISTGILPTLSDIDTEEDWNIYGQDLDTG